MFFIMNLCAEYNVHKLIDVTQYFIYCYIFQLLLGFERLETLFLQELGNYMESIIGLVQTKKETKIVD